MHRVEPPNSFLDRDTVFHADPVKPDWIYASDTTLAKVPVAPLSAAERPSHGLPRKWAAAIAASIVLHGAVAAWFLTGGFDDAVLMQGGQEIAVVQLGDGDVDATMSGAAAEFEATEVTIVPITAPKPVDVGEAEPVETVEAVDPIAVETVKPVEEAAVEPEIVEAAAEAAPDLAQTAPPVAAPQILATDTPEMAGEVETVQPVEEVQEEPVEPEPMIAERTRRQEVDQNREDAVKQQRNANTGKHRAERAKERKRQAAAEKKKAKDARAKRAAQAERRTKRAKAAGENGAGKTNARKGRADGSDKVASGANKGKGKASAAGNAAVSNYPGKVRARIARAAGKIPRSLRSKAKGNVVVSFTVTASGGLSGVSVARSSGLPALDSAAIAAVRRAAPFPAIPDGAGRSSWQFTVPMGLGR